MKKIFKYPMLEGEVVLPVNAQIIRCDHVDDGFYKGDFVWAIVDTEEKKTVRQRVKLDEKPSYRGTHYPVKLKVKEKQTIYCETPTKAGEKDGEIFVYVPFDSDDETCDFHEIAVYKTGQEIDIDVDRLVYLGLNRIWIIQELGLYTFLVKK